MPINFEMHDQLKMMTAGARTRSPRTRMRPFAREVDENEHHREPQEYIDTMWEVLKMTGGASSSPVMGAKQAGRQAPPHRQRHQRRAVEKLAWGDCGMYLSTPMPLLGGAAVGAAGTPEQKQNFLERFKEGKPKWAAMAITEPGAGSDSAAITTTADARRRPLGAQRREDLRHRRQARGAGLGRLRGGVGEHRQARPAAPASSRSWSITTRRA